MDVASKKGNSIHHQLLIERLEQVFKYMTLKYHTKYLFDIETFPLMPLIQIKISPRLRNKHKSSFRYISWLFEMFNIIETKIVEILTHTTIFLSQAPWLFTTFTCRDVPDNLPYRFISTKNNT